MLLHLSLGLAFLGSLLLAGVLARHAARVPGARLLILFLLGVCLWIAGNEMPGLFGPAAEALGLALLSTAPLTSAVFLHFALAFTGAATPRWLLPGAYVLGGGATLLALAVPPGSFGPYGGVGLVAMPNAVGWAASLVWGGLAALGTLVLLGGAWRTTGLARRQMLAVAASSGWGAACMAGYAIVALRLDVYPWPLLALPLYPVILVYGVLRYRILVANAWARRALAWTLLGGAGALVIAIASSIPALAELGPLASGAATALAFLALGGPARWLAERLVYPGGSVSAGDLIAWRMALSRARTEAELMAEGTGLLSARLRMPVAVLIGAAMPQNPAAPRLRLLRDDTGAWRPTLEGWEAAPPGPRQLGTLFGTALAEEAARLDRAAEAALRERERAQAARLAELGALAATVAHDIRNPLNIIAMAAASAPPETRTELREQIARITRLTADLLDYAKPWRVEPMVFDLADLLRAEAARLPQAIFGSGLDTPRPVRADPGRLRQAVVNLLDNAHAAPGATRLLIDLEAGAGGTLRLLVADDGAGVPPELRDALFQPFISRTPGGTGLGLAIVAKAMEAHGGTAALEARPGWSTCFVLTLPARAVVDTLLETAP
jgi:signal transduction histidine kinase